MNRVSPTLTLGLLVAVAYTLGTAVHLRAITHSGGEFIDEGAFKKLLGDGRRLFAGQFVEMADVYFHSGMYPSIFDRTAATQTKAIAAAVERHHETNHAEHEHDEHGNCVHGKSHDDHGHDEHGNCQHDHDEAHVQAMTPAASRNWLESFIRRFRITEHTHLVAGDEREILPWLKVAIELDPQAVDTYTTAAYWLRTKLGRADQAEKILREGIRNNPRSHELFFDLGLLLQEERHDLGRARNLWRHAGQCWLEQSEAARQEDLRFFSKVSVHLAKLEEEEGNFAKAIEYLEAAKPFSPNPDGIESRVVELREKLPPVAR